MKVRIIKQTFNNRQVFVPQRQTAIIGRWVNIPHFYTSEFTDMPGWFSDYCTDLETAQAVIDEFIASHGQQQQLEVVYQGQR